MLDRQQKHTQQLPTPTTYRYTGQREEASLGIYYYGARWYDPALGRFIQPDTIVPNAGDAQAFDRYAYANNNPLRYSDPTGHDPCDNGGQNCGSRRPAPPPIIPIPVALELYAAYADFPADESYTWIMFYNDLQQAAESAGGFNLATYHTVSTDVANAYVNEYGDTGGDPEIAFFILFTANQELREAVAQAENQRVAELTGVLTTMGISAMFSSPCSFSADTLVTTNEGSKSILTIQVGDKVLAWNQATGETGYYTVIATHSHLDPVIVHLTIDGETILTTPEHPFYTIAGEWIGAGNLQVGSLVYSGNNRLGVVTAVKIVEQPQVMYNLTVDQAHTFTVGDEQWLVHNGCPMTSDQQALKEIADEASQGGRKPLTVNQAETILDWADEVNYLGRRAGVNDVTYPSNWAGRRGHPNEPHIHIPGVGSGHIPVEPGVRPR